MQITMTEIAKQAGVSTAVVSRLIRGDSTLRISPQRRRRVEAVIRRHGRNNVRQRVRGRRRTRTILWPSNALFSAVWRFANTRTTQLYRSLEDALREREYRLQFTSFEPDQAQQHFEMLVRQPGHCDGLFIGSGVINQELADLLRQTKFPHVCHDHEAERFTVNTVRPHFSEGLRSAVEHLRNLGHERIANISPIQAYRRPLVLAALASCGLTHEPEHDCVVPQLPIGDPNARWRDLAAAAAERWLRQRRPITALIGMNDLFVQGFMDAMAQAGLAVVRDLSLVGVDNLEQRGSPPVANPIITTVDNPLDLIGRRMAELLINQIELKQTQIVHERIPAPLIVRQTTGRRPSPKLRPSRGPG